MTGAPVSSRQTTPDVLLEHAGSSCLIRPDLGGSVWSYGGTAYGPILRDQSGCKSGLVTDAACFPLVPFSNRLRDQSFGFEGRTYRPPPNIPGTNRVVHGFGWRAAWAIVRRDAASVSLRHQHPGHEGWPWPYSADQHIALSTAGLTIALSLTNRSASVMPAGLGLHPYFPRSGDEQLELFPGRVFHPDGDGFPSAEDRSLQREWSVPGAGAGPRTAYIEDWPGAALIHRDAAGTIVLTASDNADHLVVHAPAGEDYFCIEPVTHAVGALNEPGGASLRRLRPGETESMTMTIKRVPCLVRAADRSRYSRD